MSQVFAGVLTPLKCTKLYEDMFVKWTRGAQPLLYSGWQVKE